MADEQQPTSPELGAAPEETPIPTPPAGPAEPSEIERLRNDYVRTREELADARATVRLLQPPQQAPEQVAPLVRFTPTQARRIAQHLNPTNDPQGWTEATVQATAPIMAVFLQELAGPILSGLEGMADIVDLIQARQEIPKYETMQEEVDRFRAEMRQRGQVITRRQAYGAVESRRMQDPKYMDQRLAEYQAEKAQEQQKRAAQAAAAVTEGGATVQKAGPAPTKQPRMPQTREEFAALPLEEKRKILEGVTI
ncbi:MAG TPA: hypothetical protein VKB20_11860 [Steroidobacteraceae bacterium]|nr:hypothetical protein [Steroidobacteraceae bacterium]